MGKSELVKQMVESIAERNNTIDLDAYAKGCEDMFDLLKSEYKKDQKKEGKALMQAIHNAHKAGRERSHSPIEPVTEDSSGTEFDTLQEGDFFIGTEEEYRKVIDIFYRYSGKYLDFQKISEIGYLLCFRSQKTERLLLGFGNKKTQLTAPEFLRRAENTFNN